jgi:phosphate transport system substrate-binding protein
MVHKWPLFLGLALVVAVDAACSGAPSEELAIAIGADIESLRLTEGAINSYETAQPDVVMTFSTGSRDQLLNDIANARLDAAILFYPLTGQDIFSTTIAEDLLVFITDPANPLPNISGGDARSLLEGYIINWSLIGGNDIAVTVVSYPVGSSTRLLLESALTDNLVIGPSAQLIPDAASMRSVVNNTPGSIGYTPFGSLDPSSHSLAIDGVSPTRENARSRIYPYITQIVFVSASEPEGSLRSFLDWLLGSEGQAVVRRYATGYND